MSETVEIKMPKTPPKKKPVLNDGERRRTRKLASDFGEAFVWHDTEEGAPFWNSVVDRLNQLSARGY